jgi:hypothetical protein
VIAKCICATCKCAHCINLGCCSSHRCQLVPCVPGLCCFRSNAAAQLTITSRILLHKHCTCPMDCIAWHCFQGLINTSSCVHIPSIPQGAVPSLCSTALYAGVHTASPQPGHLQWLYQLFCRTLFAALLTCATATRSRSAEPSECRQNSAAVCWCWLLQQPKLPVVARWYRLPSA